MSEYINSISTLLIWDEDFEPMHSDNAILLWQSYGLTDYPEAVSIPKLVDDNAELFKKRYLEWVYELGNRKIKGKCVSEHLNLRSGLNYWWLTLITEKSNYGKSPQIDNIIRMFALKEWIVGRQFQKIILSSSNAALASSINLLCTSQGIYFEWQKTNISLKETHIKRRLYSLMPHLIQAPIWFINYLLKRWSLRGIGLYEWRNTEAKILFVSYLFNLKIDSVSQGKFECNYWTKLPNYLTMKECKTNWLHIYINDSVLPSAKEAAKILRSFNGNSKNLQTHVSLDTFISLRIILRVLKDWGRLIYKGVGLSSIFKQKDIMWPLIQDDWKKSWIGQSAISSLLEFNLFELALNILPKQNKGVYLQENQGWEFGFIQLWREIGNGLLIGAPHSTIRYWDLRYFFDARNYQNQNINTLPLPDKVAVNGLVAKNEYINGGYPEEKLVVVEALRYFHLAEGNIQRSKNQTKNSQFNLLILADYLEKNTKYQMDLLEGAIEILPWDLHLIVKPHPATIMKLGDYPSLDIEVTMEPISSALVSRCNAVYACNATSAAVDAYYLNSKVIVVLNPKVLNQSPLRGVKDVNFVSTIDDLVGELLELENADNKYKNKPDFFHLNQNLSNWHRQLLESN